VKKILSIAVAVAFVTGMAGFTAAQTGSSTATPPAGEKKTEMKAADKKAATKTASGTVKTAATDSLVVAGKEKGKDKEWTFAVDPTTKIKKAGKDIAAADVKEGDKVQVRYTEADGKATASAVTVSAVGAAKKAANPCAAKTDKKVANPCAAKAPEKKQ
jgi:hypothetical protein